MTAATAPTARVPSPRQRVRAGRISVGVSPPLDVANNSSWPRSSWALCHRSAGFFSRQRMITAPSSADTAERRSVSPLGTSDTWALRIA
jgi:hypothetical protein